MLITNVINFEQSSLELSLRTVTKYIPLSLFD